MPIAPQVTTAITAISYLPFEAVFMESLFNVWWWWQWCSCGMGVAALLVRVEW